MIASFARIVADFFSLAGLAGALCQLIGGVALVRFRAAGKTKAAATSWALPPVTILKPLCGAEPDLAANLRSFVDQVYPAQQVIFGVQDQDDPAIPIVRQLIQERPAADLKLVVDPRPHGTNRKVGNLINMMAAARHDILVIADSDIRVGPDYIHAITGSLVRDGQVGLVTCLYSARAGDGLASRLGAAGINYGFLPLALTGWLFGFDKGSFGATMAFRRGDLEVLGGFNRLADVLADDYELGVAVREHGQIIALSPYLIEMSVHEPDLKALWRHELRWARTLRQVAPLGYAASQIAQATVLALIGMLVALLLRPESWFGVAVFGFAILARLILVRSADRILAQRPLSVWLLPIREILSAAISVAAFCGNRIAWRGKSFHIDRHGRLIPDKEASS